MQATVQQLLAESRVHRVIDLRDAADYEKEHVPEAEWLPREEARTRLEEQAAADPAARAVPLYLYCYTGRVTDDLAETLCEAGLEAYSLKDGYYAWLRVQLEQFMADEAAGHARCLAAERSIIKKFRKEIWCRFTRAIRTYELIRPGDRIAVCISGGKDSMLMAKCFQELMRHGEQNFEVVYLVMNPGYNELNYTTVLNNARLLEVPITVFTSDIFDSVASDEVAEGNPCYLCARMRRGHLYAKARELGCNKIALGHHYDDVIETVFMGMLYSGQLQGMMPKLHSTNFPGMELIRPISMIREDDIKRWASYNELHFIQCACRFTESCASCGGTERGSKRARVKELIRELKAENPFIEQNLYKCMDNVHLATMREYRGLDGRRHNFLEGYDDADARSDVDAGAGDP